MNGRAFVLAGGLGLRLRPKFGELPKPLAPLGGRPFLALLLEWLAARDVRDAVICAGHGADALREALGDGAEQGVRLQWSVEPEPLGTGGALRHAAAFVDGPVWVLNGDTLPECDPWELERDRWRAGTLGALALFRAADAEVRGRVEVDEHDRVTAFVEKDPAYRGEAWVNGGLYAFGPALWRRLPPGASSLERDVLPGVAAAGVLLGRRCAGRFFDIGTPEDFARAEREIAR